MHIFAVRYVGIEPATWSEDGETVSNRAKQDVSHDLVGYTQPTDEQR